MCSLLLAPGGPPSVAQAHEQQEAAAAQEQPPKIPNDQLDSLVAPIASLPGSALGSSPCCINLSTGDRPASAVAHKEQRPKGQSSGGRGPEATLGPEHSVDGCASRCR